MFLLEKTVDADEQRNRASHLNLILPLLNQRRYI